jgi:hypothetical protein
MAELLPSQLTETATVAGVDVAIVQRDGETTVKKVTVANLLAGAAGSLSKTVEAAVEPALNIWIDTSP